uniref:Regulator of microtubule dynamics protein 1 n=1 Tax=Neogobius melanostomus TaxID=47308 RepID=A0A8C6T2Q0_9GOBI
QSKIRLWRLKLARRLHSPGSELQNYFYFITRKTSHSFCPRLNLFGRAAVLIGIPTLSLLGHEVYQRVQRSSVVLALEREELLEQADDLYRCGETEELYLLLLQHKDRDDAEFLWRLARVTWDMSFLPDTTADKKKQLFYESYECAKKALEKDEKCFAAHKWFAICLGCIGDYEGIKVQVENSYIIRDHLQRAIELNAEDVLSMFILGVWCFSFAELPWYKRIVLTVLFASPPESSYEEVIFPNVYRRNLLMSGKTYLRMKDREKAKLKEYHPLTDKDTEVQHFFMTFKLR